MKRNLLYFMLMILSFQTVSAQLRSVSGTVTEASTGEPLPEASVMVMGTIISTATDLDGNYTLKDIPEDATALQFMFIGMTTMEIPIKGDKINASMKQEETLMVDEVVLTASGLSREKKAIGYSATAIDGSEIANMETANPMAALKGKVAGVDITTAPGPGATQNVFIRGISSFSNNQPLYIVDGVPITNSQNRSGSSLNNQIDFGSGINAINPDDIENLTVLRGAAATALYGSRAANGLIMITTKSGKNTNGKLNISYDGAITFSQVGYLPNQQNIFGQGWSGDRALDENGSWGPAYDDKDRVWGNIIDGQQLIKRYRYLGEDRMRSFYDTGMNYKNAISLSGGNANADYYLSFSQTSSDGVIPTNKDSYDRYTVATRGSHTSGRIKISTSVNFSNEKTSGVMSGQGSSLQQSLYDMPMDISIVDMEDYNNPFYSLDNYFTPYAVNPYYVLDHNEAVQNKNKIFGKVQLDYEITPKLKATYRFGGDLENSSSYAYESPIQFSEGAINEGSSTESPGSYEEYRRERVQLSHDLMLFYNNKISEDLSLNTIVGFNANDRKYSWLKGAITSIDIPGFMNLSNSLTPSTSDQDFTQQRLMGLYANVDISFRNYLYLTLTARNDWSSTLPKDNNSFFYPGATISFLATDFLNKAGINTGVLNFAKLRLAYGQTGNDASPYYIYDKYVTGYITFPGYPDIDSPEFPIGGVNSYTVSDVRGNPDLKPEITTEFEVGFALQFFKSRLSIDFSYYDRLTKGLIERLPLDPSTGYSLEMSNLGDVRNKGIELMLGVVPIKAKDFSWNIDANYSKNNNKVERLDVDEIVIGGFGGLGIYAVEGMSLGQFKANTLKKTEIDGVQYVIVDGSGMPLASNEDEYVGKDINEKFNAGLTNTFKWKSLTFATTLDLRYGGYMYSRTKDYLHWTGSAYESTLNNREPFVIPNSVTQNGDGTFSENTTPVDPTSLHTFYSEGGMEGESFSILDKSYLKLRDITLAYDLPQRICEKIKANSIRVGLNVGNILLWTPNENVYIDPETTTFGNDVGAKFGEFMANPSNMYYTMSLNVSL